MEFGQQLCSVTTTFFTSQSAVPVESPKLIIFNRLLASSLGLDVESLDSDEGAQIFAGNLVPEGAEPLAQAYAGHQFGNFNMLGDGRALLLGEQITPQGERVDIQLKGSGRTPYPVEGMDELLLDPCCVNISLAKRCMHWVFQRLAVWPWWQQEKTLFAKQSGLGLF